MIALLSPEFAVVSCFFSLLRSRHRNLRNRDALASHDKVFLLNEAIMDTSRPSGGAGPKSRPDFSQSNKTSQPGKSTASAPLQPSLGDERSGSAQSVRSQAAGVAESLGTDMKEAAKTATRAVKEQAGEFAADVGHELSKTAEAQKMRGVEAIQCFARAIGGAAAELEQQSPQVAQSVRDAAHKVEGLSKNISNRSVDELLKAAADLARSQPMLFIGGAVAAGFAFSRFLKSSANGDRAQTLRHGGQQSRSSSESFPNPRSTMPMGT